MIKQILPVPVLAEPSCYDPLKTVVSTSGEARESTENCDRWGAAREIGSMADSRGGQKLLSGGVESRHAEPQANVPRQVSNCTSQHSDLPVSGSSAPPAQKLSDDDELSVWLGTLPRKVRFMLAMSVSALSLQRGQCRSRDDLRCFLAAAGLPISRQAIENIECRALRKCRETELAIIAKEHLTIK